MFYVFVALFFLVLAVALPAAKLTALVVFIAVATIMTQTGASMLRRSFVSFSESIDSVFCAIMFTILTLLVVGQLADALHFPQIFLAFPLICLVTQALVFSFTLDIHPAGGIALSCCISMAGWVVLLAIDRVSSLLPPSVS